MSLQSCRFGHDSNDPGGANAEGAPADSATARDLGARGRPRKSVADCNAALDAARKLIPKVKPSGPDDHQIKHTPQALFHTAATCIARAGDCERALAVYRELYPDLSQIPDPAMRDKIIRDSFDTSITHCAPQPPAPALPGGPKPATPP